MLHGDLGRCLQEISNLREKCEALEVDVGEKELVIMSLKEDMDVLKEEGRCSLVVINSERERIRELRFTLGEKEKDISAAHIFMNQMKGEIDDLKGVIQEVNVVLMLLC